MKSETKSAFKSAMILASVAACVVLVLAFANAFMKPPLPPPPKLELEEVAILNQIAPTGVDDQTALDEYYFVLIGPQTAEEMSAWNELHGNTSFKVTGIARYKILLAAFKADKGPHAGTVFVRTLTDGYYDIRADIITAINPDGTFKHMRLLNNAIYTEDNYASGDIDKINAVLAGRPIGQITANDIKGQLPIVIGAGATETANVFRLAIEIAAALFSEVANG
ncbi:MAG: hypothetical protein FWH03_00535 [Firmicutes bacterium]|nr:hypothetical protein [Bacillota bacterium]